MTLFELEDVIRTEIAIAVLDANVTLSPDVTPVERAQIMAYVKAVIAARTRATLTRAWLALNDLSSDRTH